MQPVEDPTIALSSALVATTPSFIWPDARRAAPPPEVAASFAAYTPNLLPLATTPDTPEPLPEVKKPAMPAPEPVEPRIAVPVPFWVTSSALPVLLVVRLVLDVPALFAWPRMKLPPAAPATTPDTTRASPTATTVANRVRARKLVMPPLHSPRSVSRPPEGGCPLPSHHHTSVVWCSEGWFRADSRSCGAVARIDDDRAGSTPIRALD